MIKEFELDNTGGFAAKIIINGTPIEIDISGDQIENDFVNWEYVKTILDTLNEDLKTIDEKSQKFLRFYIDNSGLYSEEESRLIKGFSLDSVSINGPFSTSPYITKHNVQYTFNYDWEAETWVDTYGCFEVYILGNKIEGIRRIQM